VPKALARIPEAARPVVTHQSGDKHIAALRANYAAAGVVAELVPFIEDMAAAYAGADVVICRAGATTVAELAATGVASLLVPFPFAVDDHQTTNARYLVDRGAAILEKQAGLTPDRLAEILGGLTRDALRQMAERARAAARPDATEAVARVCMELAK
jgi:UDP-N-acetylglucosamine--N-acetylmuramyl-(pentapeptide) pyrophosphoryl-undecaprenol N-acetylglucosamine transferase